MDLCNELEALKGNEVKALKRHASTFQPFNPSTLLCCYLLPVALTVFRAEAALRTLDPRSYHLRSGADPEWQEFAGKAPHGRRLDIRFNAKQNAAETALFIRQTDVKLDWSIELNGKRIGKLFLMEAPLIWTVPVPASGLRNGENTLSILPPKENDDILVGDFRLDDRPVNVACDAILDVSVTDADTRDGLPCRITIVDQQGALAANYVSAGQTLAARPGVVYTSGGIARINLLPGRYTVYASRGFEYGLDAQPLSAVQGQTQSMHMCIRREV